MKKSKCNQHSTKHAWCVQKWASETADWLPDLCFYTGVRHMPQVAGLLSVRRFRFVLPRINGPEQLTDDVAALWLNRDKIGLEWNYVDIFALERHELYSLYFSWGAVGVRDPNLFAQCAIGGHIDVMKLILKYHGPPDREMLKYSLERAKSKHRYAVARLLERLLKKERRCAVQ